VRLSYVSWGEERLRAAQRALKLMPGLALAHWLAATVHVARQALDEAERELTAGCAAQDDQDEGARFSAVGLHLLLGLVRLARGDRQAALDHFDREVARESSAHLYAREACANAWCAIAAVRLRDGDAAAARAAFDRARALVPGHPEALSADPPVLDAMRLAAAGRHGDAAARIVAALEGVASGSFGWLIPVDAFLDVTAQAEAWAPVLARLRARAA
jgi:tetratricopeptide (TPR) repeat protein